MKNLLPIGTLGLAGLVGAGLLAVPATSATAGSSDAAMLKRDEDAVELVLVDDDDDNDTSRSRFTGFSNATGDSTRSNFTGVSRDRDLSRSDKTRDKTWDGQGGKKRDWSQNRTNDRSRNDTR